MTDQKQTRLVPGPSLCFDETENDMLFYPGDPLPYDEDGQYVGPASIEEDEENELAEGADGEAAPVSAPAPAPESGKAQVSLKPDRTTPERRYTSATSFEGPEPEEDDPLLAFEPYIHKAPRRNSITPDLQRRFVAHLAATGIVKQAARHIGRSLEALYKLRERPGAEGFHAAWNAALDRGVMRLEDCALERSLQGVATPIVSHGQILGWWDKPDNNLLRFLLQHRLPQRYAAQAVQPGSPVYERIRQEVLAEKAAQEYQDEEKLCAEIDLIIDRARIKSGKMTPEDIADLEAFYKKMGDLGPLNPPRGWAQNDPHW